MRMLPKIWKCGLADIAVAGVGARSGQVVAELPKQPDQQLPDGQPVWRAVS